MTDPARPADELSDITNRLRQAIELKRIIQEGQGIPSWAIPSVVRAQAGTVSRVAQSTPSRPAPAARVREEAAPRVQAAGQAIHPWQRDPSDSSTLGALHDDYAACQRCALSETRTHFVFGTGNSEANVMFVGEAPGRDEDLKGEPFVGRAGQLLNKILQSVGFEREEVYIANILKCRPPGNRDPQPTEIASCEPILARQIELIRPLILCTLGAFAARTLLGVTSGISKLRGQIHEYRGVPLIPTYHPAALLRNPNWKRPTWEDVQLLRSEHDRLLAERTSKTS